ncbi:hypothetical protein QYF48_17880 [Brevibacillus agri]|uniref:YcdB/YcdC domain-containing protein n=1 Tax=Brevibacillus agri TaxID=51101 RepID=UPI0025B696F8|nr:YcdB/YcdC domain-containing protein [Brevibacillus agri]MDN4094678.1 hypothetical protein [Brevibacillus agri]
MRHTGRKRFWKRMSILTLLSVFAVGSFAGVSQQVHAVEQKSAKLLSEQQAVEAAKKWMDIPAGYQYSYGLYFEPYEEDKTPYGAWFLAWHHPDGSFISYKIHPVSSRLLSYDRYDNDTKPAGTAPPIQKQMARERALQFLAKFVPSEERAKLMEPEECTYTRYGSPRYGIKFKRVENSIPFKNNSIDVVLGGDGKLLHFVRHWYEGEVPDASKIMAEKAARELLEQNAEPTLYYRETPDNLQGKYKQKYMLVYDYLRGDPQFVDAISGVMVDKYGTLAKPKQPIKSLKDLPLVAAPKEGNGIKGTFTLEQAKAAAIHFLQTTLKDQLDHVYLEPEIIPRSADWKDYSFKFSWLHKGTLVEYATFEVRVNPDTAESHFRGEHPLPPVIDDNNAQRVDVATAKKTEQTVKKSLELFYFQSNQYDDEAKEPKALLLYRFVHEPGFVDGHTGKWISLSD